MLDGLLPSLQICLVGLIPRLEPRDVFGVGDGLGGSTVLPVLDIGSATVAANLLGILPPRPWCRRRRWRHLDYIGQRTRRIVLLVTMAVPATFSMVLLVGLGRSRAEGRKSIIIIHGWCTHSILRLVPAAWTRSWARPIVLGVILQRSEPWRWSYANSGIIKAGRKRIELWRVWTERRKRRVEVLYGEVLGRGSAATINRKTVHEMSWIMRKDAGLSGQAVAHHPVSTSC